MVTQLSKDHKPNEPTEEARIHTNGGLIYSQNKKIYRVSPGKLSVSRTFGDLHAKSFKYKGKEGVVIAEPDITKFNIDPTHDFILMGSDGLFDRITNEQLMETAWKTKEHSKAITLHKMAGKMIDLILEKSLESGSLDNVTAMIICFDGILDNKTSTYLIPEVHKILGSQIIKRKCGVKKRYRTKVRQRLILT